MTVDGFVGGPEGQLNWMTLIGTKDDQLIAFINQLTDTSDTILLGRKMTPGFMQKVVFSRTVDRVDGKNVRVHKGMLSKA